MRDIRGTLVLALLCLALAAGILLLALPDGLDDGTVPTTQEQP